MKYAAFDLEIATEIPEGRNWLSLSPLGISCAALAFSDKPEVKIWSGIPQMYAVDNIQMIQDLKEYSKEYKIVTWNGCGFDFRVLAEETGLYAECGELAMNHIDLMLHIVFKKGYRLSLDAALAGAGLAGKKHEVTLKNGYVLRGMSGALAPDLWSKGETDAVIEYLKEDVRQPVALVEDILLTHSIQWISKAGKSQRVYIDTLKTVKELFDLPHPDTSWMTNPPKRQDFVEWIPDWDNYVNNV